MIKWVGEETHGWICNMFNLALQYGMPYDWTTNWVKPLHKGGDVDNVGNYRTIMVGSIMGKLFGSDMEMKLGGWTELNDNDQAGSLPVHSTIDHLVTLHVLMEESCLMGKDLCCFVDFKKTLIWYRVRDTLWKRMGELRVPREYMHAMARIYERVMHQIHMEGDISKMIMSDIGVSKDACCLPFSLGFALINSSIWFKSM